jgi:DNA polymerase-4
MDETKLPISFGLASNKLVAKIATDEAKPNGYLFIQHGREKDFLAPLPVKKIPGVGTHTLSVLNEMGIELIGDILRLSKNELENRLGKWGLDLWDKAQGLHHGSVSEWREAKSISTENTFETNTNDVEFLLSELIRMTEKVAFELRQDEKLAGCIAVKIRYPNFETTSKQTPIDYTFRDDEFIPVAKDLFHQLYKKGMPVRLLGVRLSDFANITMQGNLFDDVSRKSNLYKAIDNIKLKFGKNYLAKGRSIK